MAMKESLTWTDLVKMAGLRELSQASVDLKIPLLQDKNEDESCNISIADNVSLAPPGVTYENVLKKCALIVLDDALNAFYLLTMAYASEVEPTEVKSMNYETTEQRFQMLATNWDNYKLGVSYTDAHKFQKEIGNIIFLLDNFIREVVQYGTVSMVTEMMNAMITMERDEVRLLNELEAKRRVIENLKSAHVKERQRSDEMFAVYNASIQNGITVFKDTDAQTRAEERFVIKWQNTRNEQNMMQLQKKENNFRQIQELNFREIDLEDECHSNIRNYIEEAQQDYYNEIEYWMERHETTLETKENEIYTMQTEIEKLGDDLIAMQKKYEKRKLEMEGWLEHKRQVKEGIERRIWAAATIQNWWREVIVKRKLAAEKMHKDKRGKAKRNNGKTAKKTGKNDVD